MPTHDIIVIGGSAGAVEALVRLVSGLPADLPAAVFVTVHTTPTTPSLLPKILTRAGRLPAAHPRDGDRIEPGRICIPPPDHHLLLDDGRVRVVRGPKENGHRPALDPMFRTAAVHYGRRVVGVVLTGMLDDGTAGLLAIKRRGGVAVAQNPNEALFPGMPLSAIANVDVDHVLHVSEIPPLLARLSREPVTEPPLPVPEEMMQEAEIAGMDEAALADLERPGAPSGLNCPECHGTLFEIRDGKITRHRCRVGHAYSIETLHASQTEQVEAALWSAVVALKEKAVLARRMMNHMRERGHQVSATRFEEDGKDAEQRAKVIQDLLESGAAAGNGNSRVADEASAPAAREHLDVRVEE
jgi:two-component system chemotaxis response regulator CheB